MSPARLLLILLTGGFLSCLPTATAGDQIVRHTYDNAGDTFIEIRSVLGAGAKQGALPFRITIRNHSGRERIWVVNASEGDNYGRQLSMATAIDLRVPDGSEVTRDLILPFAPVFLSYNYRELQFQVNASGLEAEIFHHTETVPETQPILAMSSAMAREGLGDLDRVVSGKNTNNPWFAKEFEPAELPVDWIAYSGLDALLIDASSWRTLTTAQRQAIVAWARLGGRLDLYGAGAFDASLPDLPGNLVAGGVSRMGSGEVGLFEWDGKSLPNSLVSRYESLDQLSDALDRDFNSAWDLYNRLSPGNFQPLFIFVVLLAFAILVAPINLFVLARAGRRHRLFITTPLISLGTCAVLFVMIFFIDGVGGKGHRIVLAEIQGGGENRTCVVQEQASRTGVMLGTGFAPTDPLQINPVRLPETRLNPFANSGSRGTRFTIVEGRHTGPWFRSRSEQGYLVRAAIPSRARIESRGEENGVPVLVSNLPETITRFTYRDAQDQFWDLAEGSRVASGARIPLVKRESRSKPEWVEDFRKQLSQTRRQEFWGNHGAKDRFYAQVETADAYALTTHPSIRWQSTDLLLTGNPAPGNPTPP